MTYRATPEIRSSWAERLGLSRASAEEEDLPGVFDAEDDVELTHSKTVVGIIAAGFVAFLIWAWFAELAEVSTGQGRVVPTSREQVIQSLEGGILTKLLVRQDDIVQPGQVIAMLDPTLAESNVDETAARYRAALAKAARLGAEVSGTPLAFPEELQDYPELIASEQRLHDTRQASLEQSLGWIQHVIFPRVSGHL